MAYFLSERRRGDGQHRAPGVGQAVAAYPAIDHLGERAAVACPNDQQVTRVGDGNQDPARFAALDNGLNRWISGDPTPRRSERSAQPPFSVFCPDAAQVATW